MHIDIETFIQDCRESGLRGLHVADRALAKRYHATHLRSGQISLRLSREARSIPVHAFAFDELGNVWSLCRDGHCRLFFQN